MITQGETDLLKQAVDSIVDDMQAGHPEWDPIIWDALREESLADAIEYHEELLRDIALDSAS